MTKSNKSLLIDVLDIKNQKESFFPNRPIKEQLRGQALRKSILHTLDNLPALPHLVSKAKDILTDPDADFKEFERIVATDQGIVMKVLRQANSAHYGQSRKITSIKRAAVVLGFKVLGELVMKASASSLLNKPLRGYCLRPLDMWRHSLTTAVLASEIARIRAIEMINDAFIAGLIHDVGKLILDSYILERIKKFNQYMESNEKGLLKAEKLALGWNHAEIGGLVCERWNFPKHIYNAVKYHHNPSKMGNDQLAYLIYFSNLMSKIEDEDTETTILGLEDTAKSILDIREDDLIPIIFQAKEYVNQLIQDI